MVVGNMIGSGIFLLPASLALYGPVGIVGWICAAIGAILLSLLFGHLAKYAPDKAGGPYAFSLLGLGDFAAFLVAWGYWIAIWATNAAIAVALVGYLSVFFPVLSDSVPLSIIVGLGFIWLFSYINTKPIKTVASVQVVTAVLKVIPILALGVIGIFYLETSHFEVFNLSEESMLGAITSTAALTLFAFLGMESAGIVSSDTEDAAKTVKRSTMIGTSVTVIAYMMSSIAIMGLIPADVLSESTAPFAEAGQKLWGPSARYMIAACAVCATIGALNGWILLQGRIPMAAASDHLMPSVFGKVNKHGAPVRGIIISSLLASVLMLLNYSKSLVEAFTFMMMLSTLSCLIPYLFSALSFIILKKKEGGTLLDPMIWVASICFVFCVWIVYGCGQEVVFYGFLLLLAGMPVYIISKYR